MDIKILPLGDYGANCYLITNKDANETVIVDPGANGSYLIKEIDKLGSNVKAILLTHAHFDHVGALMDVVNKYEVPVYINIGEVENMSNDNFVYLKLPDIFTKVEDGEVITFNNMKVKCIHTPGHSKGGMCYLINDLIFTGDTLFKGSIGRTDLISGNHETLINSITDKLMILDGNTKVYPGHGPSSTINYEKMINPFLR